MGRRGADSADARVEAAFGGAWEAARRVLGRLFAHAEVRPLPADRLALPVHVRLFPAFAAPQAGISENAGKPTATVSETAIPRAEAGSRDQTLLPAVRVAAASQALKPPELRESAALGGEDCLIAEAALACSVETVELPASFLVLPSLPVAVTRRALLSAPRGKSLDGWLVRAQPGANALRIPRPPAPRVRWGGDDVLIRMDLTRRGRETPPDIPPGQAFPAERRRLAETAGLPPEEVTLLGVYPGIPILAVSRLVVEEEGRQLRLWLKPAALRAKGGQRMITLLVGRRLADGKMLQAAL